MNMEHVHRIELEDRQPTFFPALVSTSLIDVSFDGITLLALKKFDLISLISANVAEAASPFLRCGHLRSRHQLCSVTGRMSEK